MEKTYKNLTVQHLYVIAPAARDGMQFYLQFPGLCEEIKYSYEPMSSGIWMQDMYDEFQSHDNFLKGIENVMTLGNKYERMKFLNILYKFHNLPVSEYNKFSYCHFLCFVCELGVFETNLSQWKKGEVSFSQYFKSVVNIYDKGCGGLAMCSATRFAA